MDHNNLFPKDIIFYRIWLVKGSWTNTPDYIKGRLIGKIKPCLKLTHQWEHVTRRHNLNRIGSILAVSMGKEQLLFEDTILTESRQKSNKHT